jgi:C-terminal processing protease CtpA/Prc
VGTKTAGNVLGAANFKVGSGYWVRLPIFGWYTSCGESLDGKGVTPHISVDVDPRQLITGIDQQMDKALEVIGTVARCSLTDAHPEWQASSSQSGSSQTLRRPIAGDHKSATGSIRPIKHDSRSS